MRLVILLIALAAASWAGPCVPGTLQDYINLGSGGCVLGPPSLSLLLNNFMLEPSPFGTVPIDPNLVLIDPISVSYDRGLAVSVDAGAGPGEKFDTFFNFQATGGPLTSALLELEDSTATDDGVAAGVANICRDGMFSGGPFLCGGTQEDLIALKLSFDAPSSDFRTFNVSSFFDVFVELSVDGGLAGSASAGKLTLTAMQTPEPGTLTLMAIAGAGLIAFGKKIRSGRKS